MIKTYLIYLIKKELRRVLNNKSKSLENLVQEYSTKFPERKRENQLLMHLVFKENITYNEYKVIISSLTHKEKSL